MYLLVIPLFQEEEPGKSDGSKNQERNPVTESDPETNESAAPVPSETQNQTLVNKCDESRDDNREQNVVKTNKGDKEPKVCAQFLFLSQCGAILFVGLFDIFNFFCTDNIQENTQ